MATEKINQTVPGEQISTTDDTLKETVETTAAQTGVETTENENVPAADESPVGVDARVAPSTEASAQDVKGEAPEQKPELMDVAPEEVEKGHEAAFQSENEADIVEVAQEDKNEPEAGDIQPVMTEQVAQTTVEEPADVTEAAPKESLEAPLVEAVSESTEETEKSADEISEPESEVSAGEESGVDAAQTDIEISGEQEEAITDNYVVESRPVEEHADISGEIQEAVVESEDKTPVAAEPEKTEEPAAETIAPVEESVDFSEEEAELVKMAADQPEFDLGEEEESERQHGLIPGPDAFDTAEKTKSQLLDMFAILLADKPVHTIRREVEAIKIAFYKLLRAEQEEMRRRFIEEGGMPEDFAPPVDNDEQRLKDLFGEYRRRRDEFIAQLDRSKEENLRIKLKIIDDLKELVNGSETLGNTFNAFRDLQQRWREAGPVPQANVKDLWETYNHHVENFYSYIKINKELRDLDLKKNYEAKMALCEEAEALLLEPSIVNSFHKLQKLHEQWRETGPVAKEYKESLWERFREASSRINKQHQEHFDGLKEEQKRNLELKAELCAKTEELAAGMWTSRKEWNKASDKLLEIQKVWKTIGFAPKKDNARIYERFRNACDRFFEQKRTFYQQVKAEMDHNLQLKQEICEAAESVQESPDWKKTTDELIALQKRWKEIGPVARRHSDAVWKRFRAACDKFFERKSAHFASKDTEQEANLAAKQELLKEIAAADILAGGFDMIKEFQRRWSEIGFVPIKQKDAVQKQYKAVMDEAFSTLRGSGQAVRMDRFRDKVRGMKTSGDKRLRFERDRLYNKVKQLESEIALLENNIGFFSNSKNAESMIRDVKEKIERTREEMAAAIEKINLIDKED